MRPFLVVSRDEGGCASTFQEIAAALFDEGPLAYSSHGGGGGGEEPEAVG